MAIALTLKEYLSDIGVDYDVVTHAPTQTASRTAQASHISGDLIAKAVILKDADGYVMAVLPASYHLDLAKIERMLDRPLTLAEEADVIELFDDCDFGAIPAVGDAYGMKMVMDNSLRDAPEVYFEGGDHASLVHVTGDAFMALMQDAEGGAFSNHD